MFRGIDRFKMICICLCSVAVSFAALAVDEDDDMFQNAKRASAGTTRAKAYIGARDEQGLDVQASLPQPPRNPDGTATVPDDEEPREAAPVSD